MRRKVASKTCLIASGLEGLGSCLSRSASIFASMSAERRTMTPVVSVFGRPLDFLILGIAGFILI